MMPLPLSELFELAKKQKLLFSLYIFASVFFLLPTYAADSDEMDAVMFRGALFFLSFFLLTLIRFAIHLKPLANFWPILQFHKISKILRQNKTADMYLVVDGLWGIFAGGLIYFELITTSKLLISNIFSFDMFLSISSLIALFFLLYDLIRRMKENKPYID